MLLFVPPVADLEIVLVNDRAQFIRASAVDHGHIFSFICDFLPASAWDGVAGVGAVEYNPEVICSTKAMSLWTWGDIILKWQVMHC